jgi:hypothetical protein
MSSRSEPQYGGTVESTRAIAPTPDSSQKTSDADKKGHTRVRRLQLTRITLDRKISPYFAT